MTLINAWMHLEPGGLCSLLFVSIPPIPLFVACMRLAPFDSLPGSLLGLVLLKLPLTGFPSSPL